MKLLLALLCISICPCLAQDKQAILEKIFTEREPATFQQSLKEAQEAGIPKQVQLEATFLYHIDHADYKAIAELSKEMVKLKDSFDPKQSEIFAAKEDWLAVVHYTQAIAALENKDKANFKKHITEAFWLSPAQAPAFGPHIEKLRLEEAMAKVTIVPEQKFIHLSGDKTTNFKKALGDNKAVLLHFWSPWAQESSLPDFKLTAAEAAKNGISVISVLGESSPEMIEDALKTIKEQAPDAKCLWALDDKANPVASLLRIQQAPTMVLINKDGKILYNGHPAENGFWDALKNLSPSIKRPDKAE